MKIETKFKIINWVYKILRLDNPSCYIPIIEEKRKVHEIRVSTHLFEWDTNNEQKRFIASDMVNELIKSKFIQTERIDEPDGSSNFISSLFVIYPINSKNLTQSY